jgi:C4-dicarboxylate-specific signal transduction histidine kinase
MIEAPRPSGIEPLGNLRWGSHFCLFYETKDDLLDALVPYFSAGLRNNERCIWIVSEPLAEAEARAALTRAIPDFEQSVADRAIEILPDRDWYMDNGQFDLKRVTAGWDARLTAALADGYEGLRVSGNTAWVETRHKVAFHQYEHEVAGALSGQPMLALCTYPIEWSAATDVLDAVRAHQFTVIRRQRRWAIVESPELVQARQEILKLNTELEQRVYDRTQELHAANEQLKAEYAERRRAEQALEAGRARFVRAARLTSMGVLAASIAHEISQPLATIATNCQATLRWLTNDSVSIKEAIAALERIQSDASRASDVIRRIRALITDDRSDRSEVDVNGTIRDVIVLLRGAARQYRAKVQLVLADNVPRVTGDRLQLQQAIMNLVLNAAEAMMHRPPPRRIAIRSEAGENGGALVSVEDLGDGLDPVVADRMFDPFFTTKPDGMGMGLAIVRWIVEAHGGRLWAEAATPRGAVFRFWIPGSGPGS